jgi:hypothetical protein
MKIYKEGSEQLHELLRNASSEQGATLLVPDLQRPYVWTPSQVTLLVDSLLRGWPFGTLLLWRVQNEELASIPSRPFWRVADRSGEFEDQQVEKRNPPAQFRMVLDGQQRLQSLLLAFGSDVAGFRLPDYEWSTLLNAERPRGRNAREHWSLGHLCIDLRAFRERLASVSDLEAIDFRDVLNWVVQSPTEGRSALSRPANYKNPIESALDEQNKGRFIRLSRLWNLAPTGQKPAEKIFRDKLTPVLAEHQIPSDLIADVINSLAELMSKLVDIKQATVAYLELSPFDADAGGNQDVYNDAIVNIFTRLNTAGRALSRQEITFAWIKNGWGDGSETGNRTAGRCFDDLRSSLADVGVVIDIDDLVGTVSAMWSVIHRDGSLLTANDLLRGEKVRPMAQDLVKSWEIVATNVVDSAKLVRDRGFEFGIHYRSLNVLTLLLTWRLVGRQWLAEARLGVTAKDGFEKSLDEAFKEHCDRWILMSQWSGRWGKSTDRTFAEYAKDLATDWGGIKYTQDPQTIITLLVDRMRNWIEALQADSIKYIEDLAALSRDRVRDYYLPLWLWHRLDAERWNASSVPLRVSKADRLSIEVDHVVAIKLWDALPLAKTTEDSAEGEQLNDNELSIVMNALGNCCLLEKSFNIAKRAEPLGAFLDSVHEFKAGKFKRADWANSLDLHESIIDPTGKSAKEVSDAVDKRTASMKLELKEYLTKSRQRADV